MTIRNIIKLARQHLANGNAPGYLAILRGAIRAAASDRAANAYRAALNADGFAA